MVAVLLLSHNLLVDNGVVHVLLVDNGVVHVARVIAELIKAKIPQAEIKVYMDFMFNEPENPPTTTTIYHGDSTTTIHHTDAAPADAAS